MAAVAIAALTVSLRLQNSQSRVIARSADLAAEPVTADTV
jgi:hypothetical protein